MTYEESILVGMIGNGIKFEKIDIEEHKIYISLPEILGNSDFVSEEYSKRIRDILKETLKDSTFKIFYNVRKGDIWTDKKSHEAAAKLNDMLHNFKMWRLI